MTFRQFSGVAVVVLLLGVSRIGSAEEVAIFSLHVGVNEAPENTILQPLRYADDDAARMYLFMSRFTDSAKLVTILDDETQKKFPGLARQAIVPAKEMLESTLAALSEQMRRERKQGKKVLFYFSYSGHGKRVGSETWLMLQGDTFDRQWLEDKLLSLPADIVHLMIDACHAEGLVGRRGLVTAKTDATAVSISSDVQSALVSESLFERYPHVGAIISTSFEQQSYEWSRLAAGVFTHELLSAIAGAGDVNGDLEIAYSEAAAFIAAANRSVPDNRARPSVISRAPRINRNTPIISLKWQKNATLLTGDTAVSGRFFIEREGGVRLLDANLEPGTKFAFSVPARTPLWIWADGKNAAFTALPGQTVSLSELSFQAAESTQRGGLEHAFHQGLFSTPYGVAYYSGWIDSSNEVGVSFTNAPLMDDSRSTEGPAASVSGFPQSSLLKSDIAVSMRQTRFNILQDKSFRHPVPAILLTAGVSALATGMIFAAISIDAKMDFDKTHIEMDAHNAAEKSRQCRNAAIILGATAVTFVVTSIVWKKLSRNRNRDN
ncbi:MAG: caspase family protein [Deltaproteobacteria bacterium]|nr:caspase family protein [Deltaproteobacteria bacterium]